MKNKPAVRMVTATEAKNRFGEMIQNAYLRDEHLIVQRSGIPVVAIVPIQDYERLVASDELPDEVAQAVTHGAKAAHARTRLRAFLAEAHRQLPDVPEVEVDQDIQQAIKTVRKTA